MKNPRIEPYVFYPKSRGTSVLRLLDQRKLPGAVVYVEHQTVEGVSAAIRNMVVRGAPAIAAVAAYGMVLGQENPEASDALLRRSRPTAVNLFHALDSMKPCWGSRSGEMLYQAMAIEKEILRTERKICEFGAEQLEHSVMTRCHTGYLATGGYGTALGAICAASDHGWVDHVWVTETRPWLQGSRITCFELKQADVPHTLLVDSAAATLMAVGEVGCVAVGVDRMARNGDFANKIGTLDLAILAKHYNVPFYVMLPTTSIDLTLADGKGIKIEERPAEEVTHFAGKLLAPEDTEAYNPSFDVTPAELITAIVTENGVFTPPFNFT